MWSVLMFPFHLIGSIIGFVFHVIGSVIGFVFGLVGTVLGLFLSGAFCLLMILGILALVRWLAYRHPGA